MTPRQDAGAAQRRGQASGFRGPGPVIASAVEGVLQPAFFSLEFGRIAERAGLPRIRLHDLRRKHALIAPNPPQVISERLGHHSPSFTVEQYAHAIPRTQAEAARQVAALIDN